MRDHHRLAIIRGLVRKLILDLRTGIAYGHGPYTYDVDTGSLKCDCGYVMPEVVQRKLRL